MIDPKIANIVSAEMQKDSIIIFDECHNIDNVCIESLSMNINNRVLD
jgi:DNA excision repair protein ERCC-2